MGHQYRNQKEELKTCFWILVHIWCCIQSLQDWGKQSGLLRIKKCLKAVILSAQNLLHAKLAWYVDWKICTIQD